MTSYPSSNTSHEENRELLNRTLYTEVDLSESRIGFRDFAHKKFIPAIERAKNDDDQQSMFTSSAGNLGTAGWVLTELALRVAELSEKKA